MFHSFSSVYAVTGQNIKIECPSKSETTLLFANRYRFSNKSLVDIYIQGNQTNSKKEKLLTFGNDEKDTANVNLIIKPNTTLFFSFQGQDCGIRLLFGTNSSQNIQCTIPLVQTLASNQIGDFSKKIMVELEKAFKSDESLLIMLLIFEKYFSTNYFLQKEEEFPSLVQNILQTSIKRLTDNQIDNLYKLISFISFKLSLGYNLTEAAAIILLSIIKSILSNDSSPNTINEIINQLYDSHDFLIFQALLINIKPNIINQSLLLPINFFTNKDINSILTLYNYVVTNKVKIHFTYINLFTLVASEEELKLVFSQNQLFDPEGTILEKNTSEHFQLIHTQISKPSLFEKKEIQNVSINFKPKKINQVVLQKQPEEKSNIKYKPKLNVSKSSSLNFPFNETILSISQNSSCSINPELNSLNYNFKLNELSIQPSKESKSLEHQKGSKDSQLNKQKKQSKTIKQTKQSKQRKQTNNTKSLKETEELKRGVKSKSAKEPIRNLIQFFIFTSIVSISIILLLCQYFFI